MSTKIYNAVRFNKKMRLDDVVQWVNSVKPEIRQLVYQQDRDDILRRSIANFDKMTLADMGWSEHEPQRERSAIGMAFDQIREETDERKRDRQEEKSEIVLFVHNKRVYGFLNIGTFLDQWKKPHEGNVFEDFSYWDNTDPPEDVSTRNWNNRKKVWNEVLDQCWSVEEVGITMLMSYTHSLDRSLMRFMDEYRSGQLDEFRQVLERFALTPEMRARRMHDCVDYAVWKPELDPNSNSLAPVMKYLREIEKDQNDAFNLARPFLAQHVLEPILDVERLFMKTSEFQEERTAKRLALYTMDIPASLQTPPFEKQMLETKVDASTVGPAPRKKL